MGLFKRRNKKKGEKSGELPELPKLSELPELPKLKDLDSETTLPQLPAYPTTKLGNKLAQDTIKEAVTGEKEEKIGANDFVREQMMPESQEIKPIKKLKPELPFKIEKIAPLKDLHQEKRKTKQRGPVFIRIDKFEDSLKIFDKTKEKISSMEKLLSEINQLKEKEERELSDWEVEIQTIKNQIEKVERDIFSKIE